jgi:hypothetical protein
VTGPASGAKIFRRAATAVTVVGIAIAAASARAIASGEREIALSSDELRAGHPLEAIQHARRAAGWYMPGAPHVRVAYARLAALAIAAEKIGDRDTALFAWRSVRTAALETRWLVTPHAEDLARADAAIARLAAALPRPAETRVDPNAEIERDTLAALARDDAPDTAWSVVLVAGVVATIVGALVAARRAVTATGTISWPRALPGLALAAAGAVAYLVAVWRA